jgi:hypothetical protein
MATDDSTSNDKTAAESQLEKQYPISEDPFAVWYCEGPGPKWSVNDENGEAIVHVTNYENAIKIADALRGGASVLMPHSPHEIRMGASTLNTGAESRAGALACMDALRIIDRIGASDNTENTWEECWQCEDTSIKAMQLAAGNHGEFMAGFVAAFAEYAYMNISGGMPNLYKWKPLSSMTDEDRKKCRAMDELTAAADAQPEEINHA